MKKTAAAATLLLTFSAVAAGQTARATGRGATPAHPSAAHSAKAYVRVEEAERVLDRALLAQGGLALVLVTTRVMRGQVALSDSPLPGTFEVYEKGLSQSMLVVNLPGGGQLIAANDGSKLWQQTPWGLRSGMDYGAGGALARAADGKGGFKWRKAFSALSLKGRAVVDGHETVVLAATTREGFSFETYFDVETGLARKHEFSRPAGAKEGERLKSLHFDSYATVDGVKVAVLIRQVYAKHTLTFRVTEVKHNVPVVDALFEKPPEK